MKNFSYRSGLDDEIEVVKKQKQKINVQSIIYKIVFTLVVLSIGYYYVYKFKYGIYDGYVSVNIRKSSLLDDAFLIQTFVNVGDTVKEGDTLFSFIMTNELIQRINPMSYTSVESHYFESKEKMMSAKNDLSLLKVRRDEAYSNMMLCKDRMLSGTATIQQLEDYNSFIEDLNYEIGLKESEFRLYDSITSSLQLLILRINTVKLPVSYTLKEIESGENFLENERRYAVAKNDAIITEIEAQEATNITKGDVVLYSQSLDVNDMDLHVEIFVFSDDMKYMEIGKEVKIKVTDDLIIKGHIKMVGLKTQIIPSNLKSNFSDKVDANIVRIDIDESNDLPFWMISDKLPVKVKITKSK